MAAPRERTVVQVAYDDRLPLRRRALFRADPATISAGLGRRGSIPASDKITHCARPPARSPDRLPASSRIPRACRATSRCSTTRARTPTTRPCGKSRQRSRRQDGTPSSESRSRKFDSRCPRASAASGDSRSGATCARPVNRISGTPRREAHKGSSRASAISRSTTASSPPRRVELLPFSLAKSEHDADGGSDAGFDGGLDMRVGLGTSTTLSATINPDFGQVELDPAVLNLSVFETFFPEKRPFFLEDSRALAPAFGRFPMFHSRRIGAGARAPRAWRQRGAGEQARPDDDSRRGEGDRQSIRLDVRRTHRADRSRVRRSSRPRRRMPTARRPSRPREN